MSLVDYASSDEEDNPTITIPSHPPPSSTAAATSVIHQSTPSSQPSSLHPQMPARSVLNRKSKDDVLPPSIEKLPDASFLLSSPVLSQSVGGDHSSRVAAAMAENASRKREAIGSSSSYIRGKVPRGNLPHTKDIPDTNTGHLVPPQLSGRSNVVTEDINKLFVKRNSQGKS